LILKNIHEGLPVQFRYKKHFICSACSGTGAKSPDHLHICPTCNGRGYIDVIQKMGPFQFQSQQQCSTCKGKGKTITEKCPVCRGTMTQLQEDTIEIPIPKGSPEGFVLKFPYGSDEYPDHAPGDLYIIIESQNSLNYRRENEHLHYDMTITLLEALIGFKKSLPHITETITIERNTISNPDDTIIIENKGLPIFKKEGQYGHFYIHITIEFPYILTDAEKQEARRLLAGSEDIVS